MIHTGQDRLRSVLVWGIRGAEDQKPAEDTDVDQLPLQGFHFSSSEG